MLRRTRVSQHDSTIPRAENLALAVESSRNGEGIAGHQGSQELLFRFLIVRFLYEAIATYPFVEEFVCDLERHPRCSEFGV